MKQVVCGEDELSPGEMRVVYKGRAPVVVACTKPGTFRAVRGVCPHQGALLGRGRLWWLTMSDEPGSYELTEEARILRCPWHGFDYDLETGECVGDSRLRVKTYPVSVEDGQVVVDL